MSTVERRVTLADVARDARVSTSTASVVFSGKVPVSAAARARVLASAVRLGYTGPDPRAASLRRGRSGIVGVVLGESLRDAFLDPVMIAMLDGLTESLAEVSVGLLLLRDALPGEETAPIAEAPVDAVVLVGCSVEARASIDIVRGRGLPVVIVEGDADVDVPHVELDNRAASAAIARHIFQLGHRDVAVVTLPLDGAGARGTLTAERLAAATVGVGIDRLRGVHEVFPEAPSFSAAGSFIDEGVRVGRALLAEPAMRPTAIIAQSDLLAAGVIRAAEELGLRVPDDLSVAGFDGIPVDGLGERTLTTAVQPAVEKGRAAGREILRMLSGAPGGSVRLRSVFRAGSTTAPPPAAS